VPRVRYALPREVSTKSLAGATETEIVGAVGMTDRDRAIAHGGTGIAPDPDLAPAPNLLRSLRASGMQSLQVKIEPFADAK
jgi:hypothetical protein